jgi:hypothetical protein
MQIWIGNTALSLANLRICDLLTGVLEMDYTVHFPTVSWCIIDKPGAGSLSLYEYQSHWQAAGGMVG